jgi:hypothetical protein
VWLVTPLLGLVAGSVRRSGKAVPPGGTGPEAGLAHAKGREHALAEELIQRLAGGDLDDPSGDVGGDRVVPFGAGLEQQRQVGRPVTRLRQCAGGNEPREAAGPVEAVHRIGVEECNR